MAPGRLSILHNLPYTISDMCNCKLYNLTIGFILLLIPSIAHADVILPSVAVVTELSILWYLLAIVILIEGLVLKFYLQSKILVAYLYAIVMNIVSTMIGIPFMFLLDISFLYSGDFLIELFGKSSFGGIILTILLVIAYVISLFALSIYIEYLILKLMKAPIQKCKWAAIAANVSSYLFFIVIAIIFWGMA